MINWTFQPYFHYFWFFLWYYHILSLTRNSKLVFRVLDNSLSFLWHRGTNVANTAFCVISTYFLSFLHHYNILKFPRCTQINVNEIFKQRSVEMLRLLIWQMIKFTVISKDLLRDGVFHFLVINDLGQISGYLGIHFPCLKSE